MANLINPKEPSSKEGFNPNVSERTYEAQVSVLGKTMFYLSCIFIIPIFWWIFKRNALLNKQVKVNQVASTIDVQLQQRADTLIKLYDATKGYVKYEKSVLTEITKLRAGSINASNITEKNSAINDSFGTFYALAENYPKLQASENFKTLMETSYYLEQEISAARRLYNSEVTSFNQQLVVWPSSVIAAGMNLKSLPLFLASEKGKKDIELKFD